MATKQKNNGKKPSISWKQTRICTTNQITSFFSFSLAFKALLFLYIFIICALFFCTSDWPYWNVCYGTMYLPRYLYFFIGFYFIDVIITIRAMTDRLKPFLACEQRFMFDDQRKYIHLNSVTSFWKFVFIRTSRARVYGYKLKR